MDIYHTLLVYWNEKQLFISNLLFIMYTTQILKWEYIIKN